MNALFYFSLLFWPQCRSSRSRFRRETAGFAAAALSGWVLLMAIADSPSVSDACVLWIGTYLVPVFGNLFIIALCAAAARRLHDIGLSGAWAFLVPVPGLNLLLIAFLLFAPRRAGASGWTDVDRIILWRN